MTNNKDERTRSIHVPPITLKISGFVSNHRADVIGLRWHAQFFYYPPKPTISTSTMEGLLPMYIGILKEGSTSFIIYCGSDVL